MLLSEQFAALRPDPGALAVCWLGQAGFWIKDSENHTLAIDPYLTECGERMRGFKRISPLLVAPEELHADLYCVTHLHFDHFDYDAIPAVAAHSETVFAGPASCAGKLREMGIGGERIVRLDTGGHFACPGIEVTAVPADHGEMAPDAIGLIVRMAGHTLYFSGGYRLSPRVDQKNTKFPAGDSFSFGQRALWEYECQGGRETCGEDKSPPGSSLSFLDVFGARRGSGRVSPPAL